MELLKIRAILIVLLKILEYRTNILMKYIKTDYGNIEAEKKYAIIRLFIEDYKNSI